MPWRRVSNRRDDRPADGGLGRTINGSYAEYTRAPISNVALIESNLLAAIPETYATAWTCLFRNLELEIKKGQLLVIRGATSSFGQAALKMAVNAEVRVIATTRSQERFLMLEKLGAPSVESAENKSLRAFMPQHIDLLPENQDFRLKPGS
jgi:NADPH:quinone reductase